MSTPSLHPKTNSLHVPPNVYFSDIPLNIAVIAVLTYKPAKS
jgi:hypothetical protein